MTSYGLNPPRLVQLREIPERHFIHKLEGTREKIDFLQGVTIAFDKLKYPCYIKTTSVDIPTTSKYQQISACFDISCRPIGQILAQPLEISFKVNSSCQNVGSAVVLLAFDNNTRCWNELTGSTINDNDILSVKVKFFGKFCFCLRPKPTQYVLTEVATSYDISTSSKYSCTLSVDNDRIDKFGSVLSMTKTLVTPDHLSRISTAIGVKNLSVHEVFNFEISGNKSLPDGIKISHDKQINSVTNSADNDDEETTKIIGLYKKNNSGIWKQFQYSSYGFIGVGTYKVMFLEVDVGQSHDLKSLQFFASELEYTLNSSKTSIYVYQNSVEKNRLHVGFKEKEEEEWKLIGKNQEIILEEQFPLRTCVHGASVLNADNSPKRLIFYKNNSTGLDFYVFRDASQEIESSCVQAEIAVPQTPRRVSMGAVLSADVDISEAKEFRPYLQDKVYKHVQPPEIYREYKLTWLKNLSPLEREKYKHINGL